MENQNTDQSLFGLKINENTKFQLKGAAVIAGVAAILALISSVLKAIVAFTNKNTQVEYRFEGFDRPAMEVQKTGNIAGAIITLIISVLLFYFLNKFSTQTKNGLNTSNQQLVNNGLGGLASYFVTIGILVIIALVFGLLAVVIGISAA